MKATEQYFPVVLFVMLYKVILTFESVDEILKCDYSNESYYAVLSCGAVYYVVQRDSIMRWHCLFVFMFYFLVKYEWIVWKVMKVRDDVSLYVTIQFNKLLKLENTQCAITTLFRHDSERW